MSRSPVEEILEEFRTITSRARRPPAPPRPTTHAPAGLLLAGGALLAILLVATRIDNPQAPAAGASVAPTSSGPVSPSPSVVPSVAAAGPLWPSGLAPVVSCQAQQPAGPDATGSAPYENVAEASIDAAFARWLKVDGDVVAFLPTAHWTRADGAEQWARFDHLVNGVPKASVLFSAAPEGSDTRWSWQLAACDPAEFAPGVDVTGGVVVWADASGQRVPTTTILERAVCGNPSGPTILRVSARGVFARDPAGVFTGRLLVPFTTGVAVPADASRTAYTEGGRQLWIAHDGKSAYVGSAGSAERWPRLNNDDASVTDCN
jgi:hypothetical protein